MADLSPVARALLETIAGPESKGNYDILYGGGRLTDYSDHPREYVTIKSGPNEGKKSSAAGKYQFLASTWDAYAPKAGVSDFSPSSQDAVAWELAKDEYRRDTGRSLESDLEAGDLSRVPASLRNQWTSLPGGIEQGIGSNAFARAYAANLGNSAVGAISGATQPRQPGLLSALWDGAKQGIDSIGQQVAPVMHAARNVDAKAEIMKRINPSQLLALAFRNSATPIQGQSGLMNPITQRSAAWLNATGNNQPIMRAASAPALIGAAGVRGQNGPRDFGNRTSDGVARSLV